MNYGISITQENKGNEASKFNNQKNLLGQKIGAKNISMSEKKHK